MTRRIAITGAAGFVGAELVRRARAAGFDVVGLVRDPGKAAVVARAGAKPIVISSGLDRDPLARAFAGAGAVVHLAQIGSERGGETYEAVNVAGTRNVAAAARAAAVARVVLFSGLGVARYGLAPRCTNRYFLSKLAAELELFRAVQDASVFRPSYIVGPGDGLTSALLRDMAQGIVEWPGDALYRLQPVFVGDAADAALAAAAREASAGEVAHRVVDLVGPERVTYRELVARLARAAAARGLASAFETRSVPIEEAERRAAAGGYHALLPDELDCLLCDETSDPRPLEQLLGRPLTALDEALKSAVGG